MKLAPIRLAPGSAGVSGGQANGTDGHRRAETVADITSRFDPSLDWDDLYEIPPMVVRPAATQRAGRRR